MIDENTKQKPADNTVNGFDDKKLAFFSLLELLAKKKIFFILTAALAVLGTLLGHYSKPSTFQAHASLYIQNLDEKSAAEVLLDQRYGQYSVMDKLDSYLSYLKSDSYFITLAEKVKFHEEFSNMNISSPSKKDLLSIRVLSGLFSNQKENTEKKTDMLLTPIDDIVKFLKGAIKYHDNSSQFIHIKVTSLDARTSQVIANIAAVEFTDFTNRHELEEIKEIEKFIQKKLKISRKKLQTTERELVTFKKTHSIISSELSSNGLASRLANIESKLETAKLQVEENSKLLVFYKRAKSRNLKDVLSQSPSVAGGNNAAILLQNSLKGLGDQKSLLLAQGFDLNSWRLKEIDKEISKTTSQLKKILATMGSNSNYTNISPQETEHKLSQLKENSRIHRSKIQTLTQARNNLMKQVSSMPTLQQKQLMLENRVKLEYQVFTKLKSKLDELEIQRVSHKKEVRVDQLAAKPGATAKGSVAFKTLFSLFLSTFFGSLIVLGLEAIDPSIRRRSDLYDCGLEYLGEIPFIERSSKRKTKKDLGFGEPEDLICKERPDSLEAMYFKFIRAKVESLRYKAKKQPQVICITSASINEGKSFVCSNLAISLAQLNHKVMLIDCDLRRPSQGAYFSMDSKTGLVDLLKMKKSLDEVIQKDHYPNLDIIPAGLAAPKSTELVSSEKFRLLVEHLKSEYDYIIIDTPPIFAAVDATVISSFSDISAITCNFRETRKQDLNEAYNHLLQISYKKVYGIINKSTISSRRLHYYGYGYGYFAKTPDSEDTASLTTRKELNDSETEAFLDILKNKSS